MPYLIQRRVSVVFVFVASRHASYQPLSSVKSGAAYKAYAGWGATPRPRPLLQYPTHSMPINWTLRTVDLFDKHEYSEKL